MSDPQPLGDPSLPRYFHHGTGLVEHIYGESLRHQDAARARLKKRVKAAGGDPEGIEYRAGLRFGPRAGPP